MPTFPGPMAHLAPACLKQCHNVALADPGARLLAGDARKLAGPLCNKGGQVGKCGRVTTQATADSATCEGAAGKAASMRHAIALVHHCTQ